MNNLAPTTKKALLAGVVFLLSCGAYYTLHVLTISNQSKLAVLHEEIVSIADKAEAVQSMKNLVHETRDERNELEAQLLARTDPTPFLELLENMAHDTGVRVEVTSLTEEALAVPDSAPLYGGVGIPLVRAVLEVEGEFAHVHHFITLAELMPYALSVERVAVERNLEGAGWSGKISVTMYTR